MVCHRQTEIKCWILDPMDHLRKSRNMMEVMFSTNSQVIVKETAGTWASCLSDLLGLQKEFHMVPQRRRRCWGRKRKMFLWLDRGLCTQIM